MIPAAKKAWRAFRRNTPSGGDREEQDWQRLPQGAEAIREVGPRDYVGGLWDEMGKLQFDFVVNQGLLPEHVLLDVGCGALRGGVHFIRYLDVGNYLGMDKEALLIEHGLTQEVAPELRQQKRPELIVSDAFEFERFSKRPNFAIAQSLFTHLTEPLIDRCMVSLRPHVADGCRFFATFFETEVAVANPPQSHDQIAFSYKRDRIARFGTDNGWRHRYIGDWGHPRGQIIVEYGA